MFVESVLSVKVNIVQAAAADLPEVRRLFEAYRAHTDAEPCFREFERELETLPGDYSPPAGAILLAKVEGRAVACVALRPCGDKECELKRLFVMPSARGHGLGKMLVTSLIDYARQAGYRAIRLETLPTMVSAKAIYRQQGFRPDRLFPNRQDEGIEHQVLRL